MFVIGALGGAITWILRRGVPASPRWLKSVGRESEADGIVSRFEGAATIEKGYAVATAHGKAAGRLGRKPC